MDNASTILSLKEMVSNFCNIRDWDQYHNAKDLSIGIVTEASELLEIFRFKTNDEVDNLFLNEARREQISLEIADVLFFLLRISDRYKIDLSEALQKKISINEIKYSVDKFKGKNYKYTEED